MEMITGMYPNDMLNAEDNIPLWLILVYILSVSYKTN